MFLVTNENMGLCLYMIRGRDHILCPISYLPYLLRSQGDYSTWLYLDHFVDVALRACELGRVFDFDEDNEVEVVPHVVLGPDVLLERHVLVVEGLPLQTCFIPQQDWLVPF